MNKFLYIIQSIAIVLIICFIIFNAGSLHEGKLAEHLISSKEAQNGSNENLKVVRSSFENTKISFDQKVDIVEGGNQPVHDIITNYVKTSQRYFLLGRGINAIQDRQHMVADLLSDSRWINFSIEILKGRLKKDFKNSEDQAKSRLLALEILQQKASEGDLKPLEETLKYLTANHEILKREIRGIDNDITDLLNIWLDFIGKDSIMQHPEQLLEVFNYDPSLKKPLALAMYYSFGNDINDADFANKIKLLLRRKS